MRAVIALAGHGHARLLSMRLSPANGNELVITENGVHYVTARTRPPCVDFTDPKPTFTEGVIGLQLHTGAEYGSYKDIYLKNTGIRH